MRASANTSSQATGIVTTPDHGTIFDGDINGCRYVHAVTWGASCLQTSSRENQDGWSVNVLTSTQSWPGKRKGMILRNDNLLSSLSWSHEHPSCTIISHRDPLGQESLNPGPPGGSETVIQHTQTHGENVPRRTSTSTVNKVEEANPKKDYNRQTTAPNAANVTNDHCTADNNFRINNCGLDDGLNGQELLPTGGRGTPPPPARICPHLQFGNPPLTGDPATAGGIIDSKKAARAITTAGGNVKPLLRNLIRAGGSIAGQCIDGEEPANKLSPPIGKTNPTARLSADAITFTVLDGHGIGGRNASAAVERAFHQAHVRLVHDAAGGKENCRNWHKENCVSCPPSSATVKTASVKIPDECRPGTQSRPASAGGRTGGGRPASAGDQPLLMTRMMDLLSGAVWEAQQEIERLNDEMHKDFGTTLVSVTLVNDVLISSSCGDSSALLVALPKVSVAPGAAPMIVELCRRHHLTEEGEISRIKKEGKGRIIIGDGGILRLIPAEMTYTCAKKSGLSINMSRSIGHVLFKERGLSVTPDFTFLTLGTLPKLLKESRDKATQSNTNRSIYRLPPLDISACKALANAYGFKARKVNDTALDLDEPNSANGTKHNGHAIKHDVHRSLASAVVGGTESETGRGRAGRGTDLERPVTKDQTSEACPPGEDPSLFCAMQTNAPPTAVGPPGGIRSWFRGGGRKSGIPADLFLLLLSDGVTDVFSSTCLIEMLKCAADMERFAAAVTAAARDRRVKGGQRPDNCTCIAVRLIPPTFF